MSWSIYQVLVKIIKVCPVRRSILASKDTSHPADHLGAFPMFYASDETETMDDVWGHPEKITGEWFL